MNLNIVLFIILAAILSAVPIDKSWAQEKLGVVESAELNPLSAGVKECGVATWVKQNISLRSVQTKGNNLVFSDKTKEIFWFAQFSILGSFKNDVLRNYKIQWIAPSQKTFLEEDFKPSRWNETFIKKSIKFQLPLKDEYIGRWRVRIWKKEMLIDDRYFKIVKSS